MDYIQHIRKTDLARNTSQIIRKVQRGQTVLVENHGQTEAAILDILDYHILRAVTAFYSRPPKINPQGLSQDEVQAIASQQGKYDQVLAYYLSDTISMGHAAELLNLPALDLQTRFMRLDVPLHLGPRDKADAEAEIDAARHF